MTNANYTWQIEKLRDEAASHGDLCQAALCDLALSGDAAAQRKCIRAISDAEGMRDGDDWRVHVTLAG